MKMLLKKVATIIFSLLIVHLSFVVFFLNLDVDLDGVMY